MEWLLKVTRDHQQLLASMLHHALFQRCQLLSIQIASDPKESFDAVTSFQLIAHV